MFYTTKRLEEVLEAYTNTFVIIFSKVACCSLSAISLVINRCVVST
ncbi:hypothetical protein JCM19239_5239 [Vibrio variabilis]|uniref:Uncharacterized protein n=1 Tax=Vibrio variabilis TaxID=990271 RepID=A0ABQ0JD99_9VIBR|nr:hypothetical protein JCM19239_5239 [Vibrio variabilis]